MTDEYGVVRAEGAAGFAGLDGGHFDGFSGVLVDELFGGSVGPREDRADEDEHFGFGVVEGGQRWVRRRYF